MVSKAKGRVEGGAPASRQQGGLGRSAARVARRYRGAAHSAPRSVGARRRGSRAMGRLLALSLLGIALALLGERLLSLR